MRKFRIFTVEQIDDETVTKLTEDLEKFVNDDPAPPGGNIRSRSNLKVTWLQSSGTEGTIDGTAMFTQLTAIVDWTEREPLT